ncbi:unnamed protein product [Clonostachys rosea f. rosea IK726]|uniref:Uncharacterized protein n=2 Tax=Clonostachys rosea f. rosea IK726 TaxID=1349383 RepID=A0ACA9US69_BIOOC|nr:unnamed protein product [Clonostachys rosea f. rosea IK726]CAG9955920.1 unnamed protein product [Clonostachys rosea f. rosea IK726]
MKMPSLLFILSATLITALETLSPLKVDTTVNLSSITVDRSVVPLPPTVARLDTQSCIWTRDGVAILCPFDIIDQGWQIGTIYPDGSNFQCISCAADIEGSPGFLYAFPDKKSIFFATASQSSSPDAVSLPQVVECSPSVLQCERATVRSVKIPEVDGTLSLREPRITPDGHHLEWTILRTDGFLMLMGELTRTSESYTVSNARVLNAAPNPTTSEQWAIRGAFSEGKSFFKGKTLVFASTRGQGGNLDDYTLDLATGAVTRVTFNSEWDEDGAFDPSGTYILLGTSRRMHNQLRTVTSMNLAPFIDGSVFLTLSFASLSTTEQRLHILEKWLITPASDAAGLDGVMLNCKQGGWASGASKNPWNPDGKRAAWGERGQNGTTRLIIATFTGLPSSASLSCEFPQDDEDCQTPTPLWAPLLVDYPLLEAGQYSIAGPSGGKAILTTSANVLGPLHAIDYHGYVQVDGTVVNGRTEMKGLFSSGNQTLTSNVRLSGPHQGNSTWILRVVGRQVCGTAVSTVDGISLVTHHGQFDPSCGFVRPEMCPDGADADATEIGETGCIELPGACANDTDRTKYMAQSIEGPGENCS